MDTDTRTQPARSTADGGRRRLLSLAAAAALLVVGGGVTWGILANEGQSPSSSGALALSVEDATADVWCGETTVDMLRDYPIAFEGTVVSKEGHQVDFRIDHWFRGGDAAKAQLSNSDNAPENFLFEVGRRYLVTAENGVVPLCGGTNEATDGTESLFREAFEK